MPRQNKAKIVATLGPSSSSHDVIRDLLEAGADVSERDTSTNDSWALLVWRGRSWWRRDMRGVKSGGENPLSART